MSKTYVRNEPLTSSTHELACALGLPQRSAERAIKKFQVRQIGDDEQIFTFTAKGKYLPHKVGRGLLSAVDVAQETGLNLDSAKNFLRQPFGFHTQNGIYSCVLKSNWKFAEEK